MSEPWKVVVTGGDGPPSLEEVVFQALGAASTCWESMAGTGVFQSERAKGIGDAVIRFVRTGEIDVHRTDL